MKKPSNPTIAEKFNTYRFADYKVKVIDLLKRVTTVSVGSMEVTNAMKDGTLELARAATPVCVGSIERHERRTLAPE